jgi:alpha/beta superfamily hydrolase
MHEGQTHKEKQREHVLEMTINGYDVGTVSSEGYYPITLKTSRGIVECRYYAASSRDKAVVFAGGQEGGWDTPVRNMLYPALSHNLSRNGINCLRIKYRFPMHLAECILDTLAGITFLNQDGIHNVGLVGYGTGGPVVIQAAASSPQVSTVVSIGTNVFGSDASGFRSNQSLLFLHGTKDEVVPVGSLGLTFRNAHDPKKVILYSGARHKLDEVAPEVFATVKEWLYTHV